MLRVTVELVPFGDESRKSEIASAIIGNIGHLSAGYSYYVSRTERGNECLGIEGGEEEFVINGHDRRQSVFALLAKAFGEP